MGRYVWVGVVVVGLLFVGCGKGSNPLTISGEEPHIVAMNPSSDQSFVASNQRFVVEFSEAMDQQSVESTFLVAVAQKPVTGDYTWNADGTTVTFQPTDTFAPGEQVQVNFGSGMRSRRGKPVVGQDGQLVRTYGFGCIAYGYPSAFATNGQQIYYSATSTSGLPIVPVMGNNTGSYQTPVYGYGMGRGMMGRGGMMGGNWMQGPGYGGMKCVSCHGPDGSGGRYLAMGTIRTPDIRYGALIGQVDNSDADHAHERYTDELIQQAVFQGIDPEGKPLNYYMPRWSMSDGDWQDLLLYLKSL